MAFSGLAQLGTLQKDRKAMTDPIGQPWNGVYNGFSAAAPQANFKASPKSWPIPKAITVGVGIGGALALGLLVGVFAKPDLAATRADTAATAPMRAVTPASATMPVVVNAATPQAPLGVGSNGKLEVLSPDMARAAQRPLLPVTASPAPQAALQTAAGDPACAAAQGRAARLVCADPELAAADRALNQAYRRALRSGAASDELRADQRDWLAAREDAARRSPRTVADLYEQRIGELNQMAEDGPA